MRSTRILDLWQCDISQFMLHVHRPIRYYFPNTFPRLILSRTYKYYQNRRKYFNNNIFEKLTLTLGTRSLRFPVSYSQQNNLSLQIIRLNRASLCIIEEVSRSIVFLRLISKFINTIYGASRRVDSNVNAGSSSSKKYGREWPVTGVYLGPVRRVPSKIFGRLPFRSPTLFHFHMNGPGNSIVRFS